MKNQIRIILFLLISWNAATVMADELKVTPQPPWHTVKNEKGVIEYAIKYPGTGWPGLTFAAKLIPERHYMLTWQMKSSTTEVNNPLQLTIDTGTPFNYGYILTPGWNSYAAFFYSGKADNVKNRLFLNPGSARELTVRDIKITEVTPEMFDANLLPDGDFESSSTLPVLWAKSYGTEKYPASIIENQEFLTGTRSMVIKFSAAGVKSEGISSIYIPVLPGKKFELSFWAKADAETSFNATAEVWSPIKHTGKHFYKTGGFKLSSEWKKCVVNIDIPDNLADYPDLQSKVIRLNLSGLNSAGRTITIDGLAFRLAKNH